MSAPLTAAPAAAATATTTATAAAAAAAVPLPLQAGKTTVRVAVIGGGNMGTALVDGFRAKLGGQVSVVICDIVEEILQRHSAQGLETTTCVKSASGNADVVLLAVKPQQLEGVAGTLRQTLTASQLLITILAGTRTERLAALLQPTGVRIVRAMPNLPMAIGRGVCGIAAGPGATAADMQMAEALFGTAATTLRVAEERIDAITAVSGSGPAYVFRFAEGMMEGARRVGFSDAEARLLVAHTLEGAIAYALSQSGFPVARLREAVTSPGGTTAAALRQMDDRQLVDVVASGVQAALARANELGAPAAKPGAAPRSKL